MSHRCVSNKQSIYIKYESIDIMNNCEYSIRKVQGIVGENSLSIILPKSYAAELGIGKGDYDKVMQENDRIIIERAEA